jgi:hypothetical protein
MDAETIANDAIGLFLEYRDKHGFDEETARAKAVCEVLDGLNAEREQCGDGHE